MWMFWAFTLSFDEDILVFGDTFLQKLEDFFEISGHTVVGIKLDLRGLPRT
jgi:hypothetical protein